MMLIALVAFAGALHLVAYGLLRPHVAGLTGDKASLIALTGSIILAWCLLLSQAMESITRAFYARADLDLILSSPASTRAVFFIRIGAIAVASVATSLLLLAPLINATALLGGAHFLSAYGLLFAMACAATAGATLMVALLFRTIGAKGARLISQIVAAIVGAGFVIGVQVIAIISYGELSRFAVLRSAELGAAAPSLDSLLWWPARAAMGDFGALMAIIAIALALLLLTTLSVARYVAQQATAAAGVSRASTSNHARELRFKPPEAAGSGTDRPAEGQPPTPQKSPGDGGGEAHQQRGPPREVAQGRVEEGAQVPVLAAAAGHQAGHLGVGHRAAQGEDRADGPGHQDVPGGEALGHEAGGEEDAGADHVGDDQPDPGPHAERLGCRGHLGRQP